MFETATTGSLRPVSPTERIFSLDVMRGFAIFGVLIAYAVWNLGTPPPETYSSVDQVTNFILALLVDSKFYTLLSFLFGLGFSIQLTRSRQTDTSILPVYVRRLLAMMLLGFAHAFLLRNGDILVPYATMGFVLLAFRDASNRVLFTAGTIGALLPFVVRWVWEATGAPFPVRPDTIGMNHFAANFAWMKYWYASAIFNWPEFLPMFFYGLYVGRKRLLENPSAHRKGLWLLLIAGSVVGAAVFAGRLVLISLTPEYDGAAHPINMLLTFAWHVHAWGFAAFYAAAILLLLRSPRIRSIASPLAAVGRMSLTNYLLQAAIIVPICIAFDLYDNVTPGIGLLLSLLVALIQLPLSVIWLRHFRYGPAEWLWRSMTYKKIQPMRLVDREESAPGSARMP